MLLTAAVRHTSALPPPVRYDSGPPTAATCNSLRYASWTENPALTCTPTPQGPVATKKNLKRRVFSLLPLRLHRLRPLPLRLLGPVFDSCRKKRIIIRFDTFGRDVSTYERRATSEAVSVRRESIVRTALRPIRTKNTLVDWMDLNATRTTYRRACHAAPFFLLLRRGAVLREGLHGIRCKRESAQLARLVTEI